MENYDSCCWLVHLLSFTLLLLILYFVEYACLVLSFTASLYDGVFATSCNLFAIELCELSFLCDSVLPLMNASSRLLILSTSLVLRPAVRPMSVDTSTFSLEAFTNFLALAL